MMIIAQQQVGAERRERTGELSAIPAGAAASLKRLCGFYGGSERELLARLIADLERDTLAMLAAPERADYFSVAA
jgi:hypothetical protein